MKKTITIYVLTAILAFVISSCNKSSLQYDKEIDKAEILMYTDTDSALSMLDAIDPSELNVDSLKAKYHYLKGYGHMRRNRSMIADSLISFAYNYYRGKDIVKEIRSSMAMAWYKFWVGDTPGAIAMFDSIVKLPNVPDSIMVQTLRVRTLLGAAEYQGKPLIPLAKRLMQLEKDSMRKMGAKYMLVEAYEYAGEIDSALFLTNELIDFARKNNLGDRHFQFTLEKAELLTELGRNTESDALIDYLFQHSGQDNGAADVLHFQYAINALNTGNLNRSARHLAIADSFAVKLRGDDPNFSSYRNLLRTLIDFKQSGRLTMMHIAGANNRQSERYNRMKASQWESERGALQQESRALALKAESEHKTVIILIISIAALLVAAGAAWIILIKRQRERDNEERIEALQKMVDEYKSAPSTPELEPTNSTTLRSAMLKQLSIIKMVAETPTEHNREMLRKISSIDGDTNGELVDWKKVFEIIDNLYSGFYNRLHTCYGDILSLKEEQIIALMAAGFSTKEISVITGQTTSTIYVRKTSIRKKLGVPGKEDIMIFLLNKNPI